MKKVLSALCIFLFPFFCLHAGITGTYSASGFDPNLDEHYTGTVTIAKQGSVYTAAWTFDDGSHEKGTGILKENLISFVFQGIEDPTYIGVQVYEIFNSNRLKGPWVLLDGDKKGCESLKKIN